MTYSTELTCSDEEYNASHDNSTADNSLHSFPSTCATTNIQNYPTVKPTTCSNVIELRKNINTDSMDSTQYSSNEMEQPEVQCQTYIDAYDNGINTSLTSSTIRSDPYTDPNETVDMMSNAVPPPRNTLCDDEALNGQRDSTDNDCVIVGEMPASASAASLSHSDTEVEDIDDSKSDSTFSCDDAADLFSNEDLPSNTVEATTATYSGELSIIDSCMNIDVNSVVSRFISETCDQEGPLPIRSPGCSAVNVDRSSSPKAMTLTVNSTHNIGQEIHNETSADSTCVDMKLKIIAMGEDEAASMGDWCSDMAVHTEDKMKRKRKRKFKAAKKSILDDEMAASLTLLELAKSHSTSDMVTPENSTATIESSSQRDKIAFSNISQPLRSICNVASSELSALGQDEDHSMPNSPEVLKSPREGQRSVERTQEFSSHIVAVN